MLMRVLLLSGSLLTCFGAQAKEWLIDVRTAEEFSVEHAAEATNIEFQQIVPEVSKLEINKQERILLYCRSGRRAEFAREALLHHGYKNVINLGSLAEAKNRIRSKPSKANIP